MKKIVMWRKKSKLIVQLLLIALAFSSCTSRHVTKIYPSSEKTIKKPTAIELAQESIPNTALLRFNVPINYTEKETETVEKITESKHSSLSLAGYSMGALGLIYWLANPIPKDSEYTKPLGDRRLRARRVGESLTLIGAGIGLLGGKKNREFERPLNNKVITETRNSEQVKLFKYRITGITTSEGGGQIDNNCQGAIKVDEIMPAALLRGGKIPDKVTMTIETPETAEAKTFNWDIKDAIAIMTKGKIDWSTGTSDAQPMLAVSNINDCFVKAGETAHLFIEIENKGKGTAYRLLGRIASVEPLFENYLFYFGKILPSGKVNSSVAIPIPADFKLNMLSVNVRFEELNGFAPRTEEITVNIDNRTAK